MQDLVLGPVEFCEVHMDPSLMPIQVLLDGISSLWYVDCNTQLGVISKPAEKSLPPIPKTYRK